MRTIFLCGLLLLPAACGGDVEPETAETEAAAREEAATDGVVAVDPRADRDVEVDEEGAMVRASAPENSVYTNLADCTLVRNFEEGGGFERSCEGPEGWQLTYTQSDLRENLTLIGEDGSEHELGLSETIARGAFNEIGDTIEWRSSDETSDVRAMIVRMNVARPDPMEADRSVLAVVRLDGPVCLIGTVPPGPGQNVAARSLVDRENLPDCIGERERGA